MNSAPLPFFSRLRRRLRARLARPQTLFLGPEGVQDGSQARPESWADWCRSHPGTAVRLNLSSRLLHELVCPPGLPLAEEADLQAYARQQFGQYFGAPAKAWPLASWRVPAADVADSPVGGLVGAVALHGPAAQALQQLAAEHDVRLLQLQPAWSAALQRLAAEQPDWLRAERAGLGWLEGQVLTWLELAGGRPRDLRQLRLREATPEALAELLQELQAGGPPLQLRLLGHGLAEPLTGPLANAQRGRLEATTADLAALQPLARPAAGPALPRPDFLGPPGARSALAWPLAATGLLVLATAGWSAWEARQELQRSADQLAALRASALRAAPRAPQSAARPAAPVPGNSPAAARAEREAQTLAAERLRSAAEVQALLQQPWETLLVHIEQAGAQLKPAPLSWLSLDVNAARQELRLEGLAADKLLPLQLADRLGATPGWRQVMLGRLQNAEQGWSGQRFELSAKLQPQRLAGDLPTLSSGLSSALTPERKETP